MPRQQYWLNVNKWNKSCINSTQKSQPIHCLECKQPHFVGKWTTCKFEICCHIVRIMIWMGECLLPGTVLASSLASMQLWFLRGWKLSLYPFTEASKVDKRSWVALHQGGGGPTRGWGSAWASSSPGPWGKHWPGRCLGDAEIWLLWRWSHRFG